MENLASILKESIMELVDNINNNPELVSRLGNLVAKSGFEWSFMEAIICGLKEEWLMDKAILVIVDTWNKLANKKDKLCYYIVGHLPDYGFDGQSMYKIDHPLKMLKHIDLKKDLESVKADELKRREIDKVFQVQLQRRKNLRTNKCKRSAKANDENWQSEETFIYKASATDAESTKQIRLNLLSNDLILHFLQPNTKPDAIIKLFTGKKIKPNNKIVWRGTEQELVYLFRNLNKKRLINIPKDGNDKTIGLWNIVASHFCIATELKNGKTRPVPISPKSLQSNSQKITDTDIIQKLDAIISFFDPDLNEKIQTWLSAAGPDRTSTYFKELAVKDFIAGRDKDPNNLRGTAEPTD